MFRLLIALCTALPAALLAQSPLLKTFALSAGYDAGKRILPAGDGYIVLGRQEQAGQSTAFLLRLDRNGNERWRRSYNQLDLTPAVPAGLTATTNGWLMVGAQNGRGWIVGVDTFGAVRWTQLLPYPSALASIIVLPDGTLLATGATSRQEMLLVKLTATGSVVWSKTYAGSGGGGLYLTADQRSVIIGSAAKVWRVDARSGAVLWEKSVPQPEYGHADGRDDLSFSDLLALPNGEFALLATLSNEGPEEYQSAFLATVWSETGERKWQQVYHSTPRQGTSAATAHSLNFLPDSGQLLITGVVAGALTITRLDAGGRLLQTNALPLGGAVVSPALYVHGQDLVLTGGSFAGQFNTFFYRSTLDVLAASSDRPGGENLTPKDPEIAPEPIESPVASFGRDDFQVSPNPVSALAHITLPSATDGLAKLELLDDMGRPVRSTEFAVVAGHNAIDWPLGDLPAGLYWLVAGGDLPARALWKE